MKLKFNCNCLNERKKVMVILTDDNFKCEVEEYKGTVVIDLYADWCGPCKMLAPVIEELEGEFPTVKFCKANVDNTPALVKLFKVESIPLVAIVKDNTYIDFSLGYVEREKLEELIRRYI